MYRIAKKTGERTKGYCLSCKHCEVIQKLKYGGAIVKCKAEDSAFFMPFNSNDFYCITCKSPNEMSETEIDRFVNENRKKYEKERGRRC